MENNFAKDSFISYNNNKIFKSTASLKPGHIRTKTEPKVFQNPLVKTSICGTKEQDKEISSYFEESLAILNSIHYYLDMSAENNNKPLVFTKGLCPPTKEPKVRQKYCKLTSKEKQTIKDDINACSDDRKQTYSSLFDSINESIDIIKEVLVNQIETANQPEEISEIIKLSTIRDDDTESIIFNNDDTIYSCDEYEENKKINPCLNILINKNSLTSMKCSHRANPCNTKEVNVSTNFTTQQGDDNNHILTKDKDTSKKEDKCLIF